MPVDNFQMLFLDWLDKLAGSQEGRAELRARIEQHELPVIRLDHRGGEGAGNARRSSRRRVHDLSM